MHSSFSGARFSSRRRSAVAAMATVVVLAAGCSSQEEVSSGTSGSAGAAPSATASAAASATSDSGASSAAPTSSGATASGATASGAAASAPVEGGVQEVTINITEADGCVVEPDTVPAGPVTFNITNVDATAVVEVHLMAGDRIRGERENLAPGFDNTFSATLDGGAYEIFCPGAATELQPFTVTGESVSTNSDVTDLLHTATVEYGEYVAAQAGFLVEGVAELDKAITAGDLKAAQQAYGKARPFFERIEPVAESFGDLDPNIDARKGDVPDSEWKGFHPIEQALFVDKDTAKAKPFLAELAANVGKLRDLTAQLAADSKANNGKGYRPDEVANGAATLLEEVQKSKITGEEERYSHIDLVDFAANVEGSQQAFAALEPALNKIDPAVAAPITKRFDALLALLDKHADPTALGGYKLYTDLTDADIKALSDALLAVQEPLSQVSAKVALAG